MKGYTVSRIILLLGLALALTGCGFHLRGTNAAVAKLPSSISPIYIKGLQLGHYLRTELENRFISSGTAVTEEPLEAAATLRISSLNSDRKVLAVDSSGKIVEYLLTERLTFDLVDRTGAELLQAQPVNMAQSYINPEEQVLGALQEEQTLREDMWRRMVDQIIRRMVAQLR